MRNLLLIHPALETCAKLSRDIFSEFDDIVISEANSVEEALDLLNHKKFDLILAGSYWGSMKGVELYEKAKRTPLNRATPFILVVDSQAQDENEELEIQGVEHFLVLPATPVEISAKINATCNPRKLRSYDRFSLPNVKITFHLKQSPLAAEMVNLSLSGMLCDLPEVCQSANLMETTEVTLEFSGQYGDEKIRGIHCRLRHLKILRWREDFSQPASVRTGWEFVSMRGSSWTVMEKILSQVGKENAPIGGGANLDQGLN